MTTTEEDIFHDAFSEAVSSKYLCIGSFLLRGDFRIHRITGGTTPCFTSFFPEKDFLISPSLKCHEHTLEVFSLFSMVFNPRQKST